MIGNVNGMFKPKIQRLFDLTQAAEAYAYYSQHMTDGKIQIIVNDNG